MPRPTLSETIYELVDIDSIQPHPNNPRQGDIGAIVQMIAETGWHTVVTVQRKNRRADRCIAGWHRMGALKALAEYGYDTPSGEHLTYEQLSQRVRLPPKGKVVIEPISCSDDVALQKVLQDNRANDLSGYDMQILLADLEALAEADALAGTGFDGDDVDDIMRSLQQQPMRDDEGDDGSSMMPPRQPTTYRCPNCGHEWQGARNGQQPEQVND